MPSTLSNLFALRIDELLASEAAIARSMPSLLAKSSNAELRAALEKHMKETEAQAERLRPFTRAGGAAARIPGLSALLAEGDERLRDATPSDETDATIVDACRRVEHHEIAAYSGAVGLAAALMDTAAFEALRTSLREEQQADEALAKVAEKTVERLRTEFTRKATGVDVASRGTTVPA